jgi:hypothetical protein
MFAKTRNRCYDFKNIFAKKLAENWQKMDKKLAKMAFFVQNSASFCKKWIICKIGLQHRTQDIIKKDSEVFW